MNVFEFTKQKRSLSYAQELSLIELLSFHCSKETKVKIKETIRNRFYSSFGDKDYAKDFMVLDSEIVFRPRSKDTNIQDIRKELLK